ncbi:MAG TPA: diacylglycerol kinase [Chromatiales bacterium]|nr:diacylglycerol kinase [Thiotrichales bacterium]HIP68543.1 diacylglycerol kinase [Chromatiales bacterium]
MNKATGINRLINAAGYSWQGLKAAFKHEAAFRQEVFLLLLLVPTALWQGETGVERALLLGSLLLVLIVEILNSAIEAVVDRVSGERHDLSGRAKDLGSAAVLLSLVFTALVWLLVLI